MFAAAVMMLYDGHRIRVAMSIGLAGPAGLAGVGEVVITDMGDRGKIRESGKAKGRQHEA